MYEMHILFLLVFIIYLLLHDRYVSVTAYVTFLSAIDKEISYSDLKSLLEKGSVFLVDVRSKAEVDNGRIPGSIHIPGERGDAQT